MSFRCLPALAGLLLAGTACSRPAANPADEPFGPNTVATVGEVGKADWPRWRGPNNDGVSTEAGLLKEWPKDGPKVAWTAKGLGTGYGTPSVAGGLVFGVGTRDGKDGVWAVKEADGGPVWFTPFADAAKTYNQANGPASTPTFHAGKLYVVSGNGTVGCFDAASGKEVWHRSYLADFGGKVPAWGYSDSVLVDGDKVICLPASATAAVAALKADTGETVWTTPVKDVGGGGGYSSPVKVTVGGVPVYLAVLGQAGGMIGVHADTGKVLFQHTKNAYGGVAQIPTPVVKGDKVFVSTAYGGGSALLQLAPEGKGGVAAKEIKSWKGGRENAPMNHHGGMVLVGDHVYFGHGQNNGLPSCVDVNTGDVKFQFDKNLGEGSGSAAYLFADGRLYIRYQNGRMFLVQPAPNESDYKVVSSFKLPAPNLSNKTESWPHPVVANGKLLIRDQNVMYAYDVKGK